MNITEAKYFKVKDETEAKQIVAVIDGATSFVVMDEDNRHYAEILRQVKEGTLTIKDAD